MESSVLQRTCQETTSAWVLECGRDNGCVTRACGGQVVGQLQLETGVAATRIRDVLDVAIGIQQKPNPLSNKTSVRGCRRIDTGCFLCAWQRLQLPYNGLLFESSFLVYHVAACEEALVPHFGSPKDLAVHGR